MYEDGKELLYKESLISVINLSNTCPVHMSRETAAGAVQPLPEA
jgi:hypothetical protein